MDMHGEDREFLPTAMTKMENKNSSKQHPDLEMAFAFDEAQGFNSASAVVLNQKDGWISAETHESFKRKNAEKPNPEVGNSKKRREEDLKAVDAMPKKDEIGKLTFGKATKVIKKPTKKNPKSKLDADKVFPVKKTKMSIDVTKKVSEKSNEIKIKVRLKPPMKKTEAAGIAKEKIKVVPKSPVKNTKAVEKAKEKKPKMISKSPVKKTKAAEIATETKIKMAPKPSVKNTKAVEKAKEKNTKGTIKSSTKKTKMAADVKKSASEKAKKKTDGNSLNKTQAKKSKTVKSQNKRKSS